MNIKRIVLLLSVLFILCAAGCSSEENTPTAATQNDGSFFSFEIDSTGWDIFTPQKSEGYYYRYGPSIITNEDGSMDAWFSCTGSNAAGELDYISYKHSDDGGKSWGNEKIVLSPSGYSKDRLSCCDPGVIKFGGYYYIGYTSTLDKVGYSNHVFVARSLSPDGPYEKWNGDGWGGYPEPLITFDGHGDQWGIGEVSFTAVDGKLYVYYSLKCETGQYTMVATADAKRENWPSTLSRGEVALTMEYGQAAADVKYDTATGKFIAMAIINGNSEDNYMAMFTSDDGVSFTKSGIAKKNMMAYAMNNGVSAGPDGCFDSTKDKLFIAYAYGSLWGNWATRMAPVTLKLTDTPVLTDNSKPDLTGVIPKETARYDIGVTTESHYYVLTPGQSFEVVPCTFNDIMVRSKIKDKENVVFSDYDESVISFDGMKGTALAEGKTLVRMTYKDGLNVTFSVDVRADGSNTESGDVYEFTPWSPTLYVNTNQLYSTMIKGIVITNSGIIGEAFNDPLDKAIFTPADYPVTYIGYDSTVIDVDELGVITPKAKGSTDVTVTVQGNRSFTVRVNVTQNSLQ